MNGSLKPVITSKIKPVKVVLGPRKCGTTALHSLLYQVRGVAVPSPLKEAHVFDSKAVVEYELRGFCGDTWDCDTQGFIDVATHYFSQAEFWDNIRETDGFIEAAVIVRDPIARAVSHCLHQMRIKNLWHLAFSDIVEQYPEIITDSLYSSTLPRLKACFGENSLRLIKFEQLVLEPRKVVSELCGDFDLVEPVGAISPRETQMNRGFRPKFPRAYSAFRQIARMSRAFLGDTPVERIKEKVMPIWPTSEHSMVKRRILDEIRDDPKGKALDLERAYIAGLVERF